MSAYSMRVRIICSIHIAYPPSPRCDRHLRPPSRCPDPHAEWHRGACAPKLPSPDLKHCNILIHIYVYICAQSATPSRTRARPRPPTATPATTTPPSATAPKSSPVRPAAAAPEPSQPSQPSRSESIHVVQRRADHRLAETTADTAAAAPRPFPARPLRVAPSKSPVAPPPPPPGAALPRRSLATLGYGYCGAREEGGGAVLARRMRLGGAREGGGRCGRGRCVRCVAKEEEGDGVGAVDTRAR